MESRKLSEVIKEFQLPNPTTPVPLEKFLDYKESEDILDRAAFWSFYCAWEHDHLIDKNGGSTQVTRALAVEARNDGHMFLALKHYLHLTDSVLMRKDQLAHMEVALNQSTDTGEDDTYVSHGVWVWVLWALAFCMGLIVGVLVW